MPLLPPFPVVEPAVDPPAIHWSAAELPAERPDGWLALVLEGAGANLVEVRRVPPEDVPCSDDDECGGWCPTSTIDPDVPAVVLLRRPDLRAGPVTGAIVGGLLAPGSEWTVRAGGATSHLVVSGARRDLPEGIYDSCTVQGTVVLRHRDGTHPPTDTVIWGACADHWPRVAFAGDLDGDGVPEILTVTSEGSSEEWVLWWSDPARPGAVRRVADNYVSDC